MSTLDQSPASGGPPEHDVRWRWQQLIWLGYLPLILINAAVNDTSLRQWTLLIISLLFIAVLVVRAVREVKGSLLPLFVFSLGLGLLLSPQYMAGVILLAYAAGAAAHMERPSTAMWLIGVVVVAATLEASIIDSAFVFSFGAALASFVGLVNLHFANYRRANLTLRRANAEIERLAAVAERERIARDLHDVLGHTLSLITLKSELAMRLAEQAAPAAAAESRDVRDAARAALAEIREVVSGHRARLTDEVGRARALLEAARVDADFDIAAPGLAADMEDAFAFALREGVTNVVRHANARRCNVSLQSVNAVITLDIEDDGAGVRGREGNGLRGMRERMGRLGGHIALSSADGTTRLRVEVP